VLHPFSGAFILLAQEIELVEIEAVAQFIQADFAVFPNRLLI